jgi:hypothetical protein
MVNFVTFVMYGTDQQARIVGVAHKSSAWTEPTVRYITKVTKFTKVAKLP